jgi:hypothetical protein
MLEDIYCRPAILLQTETIATSKRHVIEIRSVVRQTRTLFDIADSPEWKDSDCDETDDRSQCVKTVYTSET